MEAERAAVATVDQVGIRRVGADDAQALRTLRLQALFNAPDAFSGTYEEALARPMEAWRSWAAAGVRFFFEADRDGPVGLVVVLRPEPLTASRELMSMWVAPTARGLGVGDALVQAALAWSRADGATRGVVRVYEANRPARRLYERHGFRPNGVVEPADDRGRVEIELDVTL